MSDPALDIIRDVDVLGPRQTPRPARDPLDELLDVFRGWLYLPDPGAVLVALGTVAANRLGGDPVWSLLVGPPGSGKSEILVSLGGLPDVHPAATLTEAALLSGTPKRERDDSASGGLLKTIGPFGILVCKDFGSILSMNRDARGQLLAALREVYDGAWTRHIGTDGGKTLHWSGRVGLVAGCTPTIDRHHGVMAAMGERFALFRLPASDEDEQARRALAHAGREEAMRRELAEAVCLLFERPLREPAALTPKETSTLVDLAAFAVRARSAVERDGYSREIELIPEPEAPTRLVVVLERLLAGLDAIGVPRDRAWNVVRKVALDSIPSLRRTVVEALEQAGDAQAADLAASLGYPTTTTRRALEDLAAHGVTARSKTDGNDIWRITEWARERLACIAAAVPPGEADHGA